MASGTPPSDAARHFMLLLSNACERIHESWFDLPFSSDGRKHGRTVYRERVYCYELYHQLRLLSRASECMPAGARNYLLSGEIDKSGTHSVTRDGKHKPDLVWHIPGDSQHNAVVVEVKPAYRWSQRGVVKDLETLSAFLSAGREAYRVGVLLVFGESTKPVQDRVRRAASCAKTNSEAMQRTRLLWHPAPCRYPVDLGTIA